MSQCSYKRRDGSLCPEEVLEGGHLCFWHDENADKSGSDIKEKIEAKVKDDTNCQGYQLKKANLHDAWLTETDFTDANLSKANLSKGHLFGINLKRANLFKANCAGANLRHANAYETNVLGTNFENAKIDNIDWGPEHILLQELEGDLAVKQRNWDEAKIKYKEAEEIYLTLKNHFSDKGNSNAVGVFFYREMIVQRRQLPLYSPKRFFMKLADVSCGYGEKVGNIFTFSILVIIFNAIFYSFGGVTNGDTIFRITTETGLAQAIRIFFKMLYYSTVTFTTLGYGELHPASTISRFFAGIEAFMGAFLVALFVITVYKNLMSR